MRKNQSGGLGNEEWQRFWNSEQGSYQDDLLGRFQARNNGKEGNNTGLIENETILQKLSPFIKPISIPVSSGEANKPEDFVYRMSLMVGDYDCKKINYNQRSNVLASVIDPPSASANTYYFLEYDDYYEILPDTVTDVNLDYVMTPPDVIWGSTYDDDGRQVYSEGRSVQSLWDNNSNREITKRILKVLGVSFKDNDFANFGQSVITTGE